jgi:hypothetical protein
LEEENKINPIEREMRLGKYTSTLQAERERQGQRQGQGQLQGGEKDTDTRLPKEVLLGAPARREQGRDVSKEISEEKEIPPPSSTLPTAEIRKGVPTTRITEGIGGGTTEQPSSSTSTIQRMKESAKSMFSKSGGTAREPTTTTKSSYEPESSVSTTHQPVSSSQVPTTSSTTSTAPAPEATTATTTTYEKPTTLEKLGETIKSTLGITHSSAY